MHARRGTTIRAARPPLDDAVQASIQREILAEFTKRITRRLSEPHADSPVAGNADVSRRLAATLPPRVRQTLDRLLVGESEKQIAAALRISKHTVHTYVKTLHAKFEVSSRGELLARFVSPGSPV